MTKREAKAARLPVMLTIPTLVFILPCVFLIAGGPAIIKVMDNFHHSASSSSLAALSSSR